jgi:hypothetical protein
MLRGIDQSGGGVGNTLKDLTATCLFCRC